MSASPATCAECQAELQPGMLRCRACGARVPKSRDQASGRKAVGSHQASSLTSNAGSTSPVGSVPGQSLATPRGAPAPGGTAFQLDAVLSAPTPPVSGRPVSDAVADGVSSSQDTGRTPVPAVSQHSKPGSPKPATVDSAAAGKLASTGNPVSASSILEIPTGITAKDEFADRLLVSCVCSAKFRVKLELAGKRIKCPKCGQGLAVPASVGEPTATVSGRMARPPMPATKSFAELSAEVASSPPQMADPPELKERLGKGRWKKLAAAIEKKDGEGKAEAELRKQKILELGTTADSRVVPFLEAYVSDYWISVREGIAEALGELRDPAGVPLLIRLLGDDVPEVRRDAIVALGKVGDARAVTALIDVALEDPKFRYTAEESVVRIGNSALPILVSILKGDDPSRTLEATIILGRIKDPAAAEPISILLGHRFAIIRGHAAESLGHLADPKTVPVLIKSLTDADAVVRAQVIAALQRLNDKRAIKPLMKSLEDHDIDVCVRAAVTLGELGGTEAAPALLPLLDHSESEVRGAAADALGKLGSELAAEPLTQLFQDEDENVRLKAVSAFRRFKSETATAPLLALLTDGNVTIRQRAVDALGEIGNLAALDQLVILLRSDGAVEVRMAAAKALGLLRSVKALPALEEALDDDLTVRCRAIAALGDIGDASSLPALLAMLRDTTPEVRYHASQSLAEIGHQNSLKPLEELLGDDSPMVRRGAAKALIKLGDPRGEQLLEQASKPARAGSRMVSLSWSPDWLAGLLMPSSGQGKLALLAIPVSIVIAGLAWLAGPSIMTIFEAPDVIVLRGNVSSVAFSPDGSLVALGRTGGMVELWDHQAKKIITTGEMPSRAQVIGLTVLPDGKTIVAGAGKEVQKLEGGKFQPLSPHAADIQFFAGTSDGKLALSYARDGTVFVWDLEAGIVSESLRLQVPKATVFAMSQQADMLAVGNFDGVITLFDVKNAAIHKQLGLTRTRPLSMVFSDDGKWLAILAEDMHVGLIDVALGKSVARVGYQPEFGTFQQILMTPGATPELIVRQGGRLLRYSVPEMKEIEVSDGVAGQLSQYTARSNDGKWLVGGSSEESPATVMDLSSGKLSAVLDE